VNSQRASSRNVNKPSGVASGRPTGEYVTISTVSNERVRAFVPAPLPPSPPVAIDGTLRQALDAALLALGRLDGVSALLPDPDVFLYTYVRKEAVLSSQIEGTQASLSDLLLAELDEAPGVPLDDVTEVSNCVAALEHGLQRLRGGFPLSNRLLRETHDVLLRGGRGAGLQPGRFRRSQNWIGGTRPGNAVFVPPPPDRVEDLMAALERFLHERPERTPTLLKAAFAHPQFETIHPFLDGNGRVGRLLITFVLMNDGVLREPLLYLSLYFKQHRHEYYERLDAIRKHGDWIGWLRFFADAVVATARSAVETSHRLTQLFAADLELVHAIGRGAGSGALVHGKLRERPLWNIQKLASATHLSVPTVTRALEALQRVKIVREVTGRRRSRVYAYDEYLRVLNEGTELT
jgi:Fic family protein